MDQNDIELLNKKGWIVECEMPFEISHKETNSFATNIAAQEILENIIKKEVKEIFLVKSKVDYKENYKDLYKIFFDGDKAVAFARERMKKAGLLPLIFPECEDEVNPVGMIFLCEAGDQFVKIIRLDVEE